MKSWIIIKINIPLILGLTSDDTSGDKSATNSRQIFTGSITQTITEVSTVSRPTLMTQSTSALLTAKRSPRRALRPAPNTTQLNSSINQSSNDSSSTLTMSTAMNLSTMNNSATSTVQAHASSSSSSTDTDTSPFDEKRPIPIPRKVRPIMGNQMLLMNKSRVPNQVIFGTSSFLIYNVFQNCSKFIKSSAFQIKKSCNFLCKN